MLMEEGVASPGGTLIEPTGKNVGAVGIDRDQARVELNFVMDERDRLDKLARMAGAERDRLAEALRAVEAERDLARERLAAAIAERDRLSTEVERLGASLEASGRANARAEKEIAWLRALTEQLALQGRDRTDGL
jgi:hypothetical protein